MEWMSQSADTSGKKMDIKFGYFLIAVMGVAVQIFVTRQLGNSHLASSGQHYLIRGATLTAGYYSLRFTAGKAKSHQIRKFTHNHTFLVAKEFEPESV